MWLSPSKLTNEPVAVQSFITGKHPGLVTIGENSVTNTAGFGTKLCFNVSLAHQTAGILGMQGYTPWQMKTGMRIAALLLTLVVVAIWFFGGASRHWTQTKVMHKEMDPVTEIEKVTYEPRFVPGIDFLAAGIGVAAIVGAGSFAFRKKT
jgi:hypothetical protein